MERVRVGTNLNVISYRGRGKKLIAHFTTQTEWDSRCGQTDRHSRQHQSGPYRDILRHIYEKNEVL